MAKMDANTFHALYAAAGPGAAPPVEGLTTTPVHVALELDDGDLRAMFNGYATDVPDLVLVPSGATVALTHELTGRRLVQCPMERIWTLLIFANHIGSLVDWGDVSEPGDLLALDAQTRDRLRSAMGTFAERNEGHWVRAA